MHVLGTVIGIRVRWSMRVLRWVKQSLCSLSVLNVGWEDGEGEGAELLEGICWCYANHVCHIAVKVCRVAGHPVEVCRVAGHRAEMRRVAGHPVEVRRLSAEMRHLAEHLADFAVKQGSSCLYSLGTASMYCFFLFAFTCQLESPFTCHQIVSNGSLQATRVQSSAAATPNGRVRIGEDEGVPERKAYTQSLQ